MLTSFLSKKSPKLTELTEVKVVQDPSIQVSPDLNTPIDNSSPFDNHFVNNDIIKTIACHLDLISVVQLSQTCKKLRAAIEDIEEINLSFVKNKKEINATYKNIRNITKAQIAPKKALEALEPNQISKFISKNPLSVTMSGTILGLATCVAALNAALGGFLPETNALTIGTTVSGVCGGSFTIGSLIGPTFFARRVNRIEKSRNALREQLDQQFVDAATWGEEGYRLDRMFQTP